MSHTKHFYANRAGTAHSSGRRRGLPAHQPDDDAFNTPGYRLSCPLIHISAGEHLRNTLALLLPLIFILPTPILAAGFTGSEVCKDCHAEAYEQWRGSHHDLAMQLPTAETVLGDFDNRTFDYNGITTRFTREGVNYFVHTDGEDGKLQTFPVKYVFGVYPLQQYLLPLDRGRLQALSIAWDARPAAEGGQRWYHLYPDETVDYRDPLHWTGPYQNWNTRCAECHSTDVQKNYTPDTHSFDTRYAEINVGCEGCHGPGETHVGLARAGKLAAGAGDSGLPTQLSQHGQWQFSESDPIARRTQPLASQQQIEGCARCHARRGTLGDYHYGADFLDTHRLALPQAPLYYYDGQIRDEVYVYGSFLQSKMHQAGVVCSNCHEPHSQALRAPGNAVCTQCHRADVFDTQAHHHHPAGSDGALCANCHMPETTYMGVDPRRDHSFRIPRPDLSMVMQTPNACTMCHADQKPQWALDALREWGVNFTDTSTHRARVFERAGQGDARSTVRLSELAMDGSEPLIWRATAMETLGQFGGRDALQTATQLLYSDEPLLRVSTIRALSFLSLPQRLQLFAPLFDDEVSLVRMEVANALAGVPLDQIPPEQAAALENLFREYVSIQRQHADMPSVQMQLGLFYLNRGDTPMAEAAYREALNINPQLITARLNFADLLRSQGREDEAREQLQQALAVAPEHGAALHALGLLETRSGNDERALDLLSRAAALETQGTRHRFVYAIALHDLGQPENAIKQLQSLLRDAPADQQVMLALANYNLELGRKAEAQRYARQLLDLAPRNAAYQALYRETGGG